LIRARRERRRRGKFESRLKRGHKIHQSDRLNLLPCETHGGRKRRKRKRKREEERGREKKGDRKREIKGEIRTRKRGRRAERGRRG